MSGKGSQRKGRAAELELCRVLQRFGIPAEPGPPRSYGKVADIIGWENFHIECKRCESWRLKDWIKQARKDAAVMGGIPLVVFRSNRDEWKVCLSLSDFMQVTHNFSEQGDGDAGDG